MPFVGRVLRKQWLEAVCPIFLSGNSLSLQPVFWMGNQNLRYLKKVLKVTGSGPWEGGDLAREDWSLVRYLQITTMA